MIVLSSDSSCSCSALPSDRLAYHHVYNHLSLISLVDLDSFMATFITYTICLVENTIKVCTSHVKQEDPSYNDLLKVPTKS